MTKLSPTDSVFTRLKRLLGVWGRPVLFVVGVGALATLVIKIGPKVVWGAMQGAGAWLPVIFFLDFCWMALEGGTLLVLYGRSCRVIPKLAWLEATLIHYSTFMVAPMGRATAEVARASLMARYVGSARATAGAFLMQSITFGANALMSLICLSVVWLAGRSPALRGAIGLNLAITGSLGIASYMLLRHVRVGGRLGRLFPRLSKVGPNVDQYIAESRPRHIIAVLVCVMARNIQTLQYAVIYFAVVASVSSADAYGAQAIQMVSRTLGDFVPNQVGVTEAAYFAGAEALNLARTPEKAVAIALLARLSNLLVAGSCALLVQLLPKHAPTEAEVVVMDSGESQKVS